jgi:co-chaperonin GroES (HSP10)
MQLLHSNVLIKQEESVKEEKTKSGIIILKTDYKSYQFGSDNQIAEDILFRKKHNKGKAVGIGVSCAFVKKNDTVIFKKQSNFMEIENNLVVEEKDIMVKVVDGKYIVHPNSVLVKITKESRDTVFTKKIKRDDGTFVDFVMAIPPDKESDNYSTFFVSTGIIVGIGENVTGILINDIAILDYQVDNNEDIIVGYDGEDKLVCVDAVTTRHEEDYVVYATRQSKRDQIVYSKGDFDILSKLLGIIRNQELIARDPYVFLNHKTNVEKKQTKSGITYNETKYCFEREILSAPKETTEKLGFKKGDRIMVSDFDIFDITVDDKKISCIHDIDIITKIDTLKKAYTKKYLEI